jgi:hypothetical protein
VKKFIVTLCLFASIISIAQDSTSTRRGSKKERREEKRERIDAMIRQEEEGVLSYYKQNAFGLQLRTDGYGIFYEIGRYKTPRFANLYLIEFTEIKHRKEEKTTVTDGFFSNSFIYGKLNNFYQFKLGFGQQYIFGQKGNKNGVAVMGIYQGGLSLGLLRPYYLSVVDNGSEKDVKYDSKDSLLFLTGNIQGSSGFSKGWNEIKIKPGAFVKTALRFDFGRYNEMIQAIQIGLSIEAYAQKIPVFYGQKEKQIFFQGHLAFLFGRRK